MPGKQDAVMTSNTYDSEFTEIFTLRPRRYAVSMLRSQREEVLKTLREKELAGWKGCVLDRSSNGFLLLRVMGVYVA